MAQDELFIDLKSKTIRLMFEDFENEIDVDSLTTIHYENLYGEAITISALLNKVGLMKAELEELYEDGKITLSIFEAKLRNNLRREAANNAGKVQPDKAKDVWIKLTEKAIDDLVILDGGWQVKKKNVSKRKKDLGFMDALYWAVQSKDKKLNNMLPQLTPQEFAKEIVEGKINGIVIKKYEKKYSN